MEFRLVCGACVLALTGCFADPPTGTGGGDESTSAESSSSGTSAESSTTGTEESTSTGAVDGGSSSGSSSGGTCEATTFSPPAVPADIVALVDAGLPTQLVQTALAEFQSVAGNNVAILAPQSELASLDLDSDCPNGCGMGGCGMPANRVIVPYTGTAYDALVQLASFDCIFREPAPGTSGPVANLWFITAEPLQVPPKDLSTLVLEGEIRLRVHVACPGCDENLFNAASLLEQVVSASGGTVANTNSPVKVVAQATYIGGPRHSCAWEADASPDFYIFDPTTDADEFFADPVASQGDCPTEMVWSGDSGAFHPDDEIGGFRLCPETCKSVQAFPVDFLDIYSCE